MSSEELVAAIDGVIVSCMIVGLVASGCCVAVAGGGGHRLMRDRGIGGERL
jgi:hypothetical protein